ncbi:MAG: YqgE/AlgH family protein [Acidobacteria bacterium]|nr:MAG: YqgE/AlgH family protein [Acidobacteriota bacterium]
MGRAAHGAPERSDLAPGFVAAMPQLLDPNFHRTVVFLLRHNDEGSFGLVINRPTQVDVQTLCESQGIESRGQEGVPMMFGGPVEIDRHLLALHGEPPLAGIDPGDEIEIARGVRLVTALDGLAALAGSGSRRFRCYAGYAGWGPGQLEEELEEGAWVPLEADPELIFDEDPARVWELALRRAGIDPITLVPGGGPS